MPKYLVHGSYTAEGLQGLIKDKASGRKAAVAKAIKGLGAKLEAMYYGFGADDVYLIVDAPDNMTVAAVSVAACATGLVRIQTTPLLTIEETDQALEKTVNYRGPGQ